MLRGGGQCYITYSIPEASDQTVPSQVVYLCGSSGENRSTSPVSLGFTKGIGFFMVVDLYSFGEKFLLYIFPKGVKLKVDLHLRKPSFLFPFFLPP